MELVRRLSTWSLSHIDSWRIWLWGAYLVSLVTTMSGMEIFSSAILILLIVPKIIENRSFVPWPKTLLPLGLFSLIVILGIVAGEAPRVEKLHDLGRLRFFGLYLGLYFLMAVDSEIFELRSRWLFNTLCIVGVYGFVQHFVAIDLIRPADKKVLLYAIQDEKIGPLVVGFFNHHLTFSNLMLFHACVFAAVGVSALPKWTKEFGMGVLLLLLTLWTQSRIAWVAVPLCFFLILSWRKLRYGAAAILIIAVFIATSFSVDSGFRERFSRTWIQESNSLYHRLGPREGLWRAQWQMLKENFWIGVGSNNNERKAKEYVDKLYPNSKSENFYGHAHSLPLQILACHGILGFLSFVWLWAVFFSECLGVARSKTKYAPIGVGLFVAFFGFWIQGLTQWNFGDAEVLHNVVFFWALASSTAHRAKLTA